MVHTVRCTGCETTRVAREVDRAIVPYRGTCPECGDSDYEVVA